MDVTNVLRIVPATERDAPLILQMIKDLAEYERMADQVKATEASVRETLFGARPAAEVVIGYAGEAPAGFALFFPNYSTFVGRPGLYLEDLFVRPEFRGHGFGKQLLVSSGPTDPNINFDGTFIGDYNGLAASAHAAHPIWTDARRVGCVAGANCQQQQDAVTATVSF